MPPPPPNQTGKQVVDAFRLYVTDLNAEQLKFLGLTEKDRDNFCSSKVTVKTNEGLRYIKDESTPQECVLGIPDYSPEQHHDYLSYAKIVVHELGHRMDCEKEDGTVRDNLSKRDTLEKIGSYLSKAGDYIFKGINVSNYICYGAVLKTAFDFSTSKQGMSRRKFLQNVGVGAAAFAVGPVGKVIVHDDSLDIERSADDFADRVMYNTPIDFHQKTMKKELYAFSPLEYEGYHPPEIERELMSQYRCNKYATEAEELQMPDFRKYLPMPGRY